jgi:hypothetical protein
MWGHGEALGGARKGAQILVAAIMVTGLSVPAAASAAPQWLGPVAIASSSHEAREPVVATNASGETAVLWQTRGGILAALRKGTTGRWQRSILPYNSPQRAQGRPQVAIDAEGDVIAIADVSLGYNAGTGVVAMVKPAGRPWQGPVRLNGAPLGEGPGVEANPHLAADAKGDAVVVWSEMLWQGAPVRSVVNAAVMQRASGSWSAPARLSEDGVLPRAAVDRAGDAMVVWRSSALGSAHPLEAARGSAAVPGGGWQRPEVAVPEPVGEDFQVALSDAGGAALTWMRASEWGDCPRALMASTRVAGSAWRPPVQLSATGACAIDARLAIGAHGTAVAAWESDTEPSRTLEAATGVLSDGSWRHPEKIVTVSRFQPRPCPDLCARRPAAYPQLAVGPKGDAALVWSEPEVGIEAVLMPGDARRWGPVTRLSQAIDGYGPGAHEPQIALDSRGGGVAVMGGRDLIWANTLADQRPLAKAGLSRRSVRFTLTTPARVRIVILRLAPGVRLGARCAPLPADPKASSRRCLRKVEVGVLANRDEPRGRGRIPFGGRLGSRKLKPGSYEAVIWAHARGARSAPVALPFTVPRKR